MEAPSALYPDPLEAFSKKALCCLKAERHTKRMSVDVCMCVCGCLYYRFLPISVPKKTYDDIAGQNTRRAAAPC